MPADFGTQLCPSTTLPGPKSVPILVSTDHHPSRLSNILNTKLAQACVAFFFYFDVVRIGDFRHSVRAEALRKRLAPEKAGTFFGAESYTVRAMVGAIEGQQQVLT